MAVGLKLKSPRDLERAYRGLGHAHKRLGNLQQALVCFEKRLVVAHELNSPEAKASAYGELGHIHTSLGNYQQAISCLQHQLLIARLVLASSVKTELEYRPRIPPIFQLIFFPIGFLYFMSNEIG